MVQLYCGVLKHSSFSSKLGPEQKTQNLSEQHQFLPSSPTSYIGEVLMVYSADVWTIPRSRIFWRHAMPPLLQGLKVAEDPLSVILTSTFPHLLLTRNRVAELTLTAFQSESGLRVTQRLSPFPLGVLTNYSNPNLIAPGRLVVSG